jgi:hypothetical protein
VTKPNCLICRGLGWVCEKHPDRPWTETVLPCQCNGGTGIVEPNVSGVVDETPPVKH